MKPHKNHRSGLVDLGSAITETKGPSGVFADDVLKRPITGLTAE